MELSIVIPAYNEGRRLVKTLERIYRYLEDKRIDAEVIVVDDGSKDETAQLVLEKQKAYPSLHLISNEGNKGKGYSVKTGVLAARGDLVLFSDADLSTPIEEIEKLKTELKEGYSVVIASRSLKDSKIKHQYSRYRKHIGRFFNAFVQLLTGFPYQDTQCGFKLFTRDAVQKIFPKLKLTRFSFDVEILWLAKKYQLPVSEIPVRWIHKPSSQISVLKDGTRMFFDIVQIRVNDLVGRYR